MIQTFPGSNPTLPIEGSADRDVRRASVTITEDRAPKADAFGDRVFHPRAKAEVGFAHHAELQRLRSLVGRYQFAKSTRPAVLVDTEDRDLFSSDEKVGAPPQ